MHGTKAQAMQRSFSLSLLSLSFSLFIYSLLQTRGGSGRYLAKKWTGHSQNERVFPSILNAPDPHLETSFLFRVYSHCHLARPAFGNENKRLLEKPLKICTFVLVGLLCSLGGLGMGERPQILKDVGLERYFLQGTGAAESIGYWKQTLREPNKCRGMDPATKDLVQAPRPPGNGSL